MFALLLLSAALAHPDAACGDLSPSVQALEQPSRCLTPLLMAGWQQAEQLGEEDCWRQALRARGLPATGWAYHALPAPTVPPPPDDKATRDVYGAPNSAESVNFVLRWGSRLELSDDDAAELLSFMEDGWAHDVDTMGMPQPTGTQVYKFNVYVGDTGPEVPSAYGNGGYFTYDNDWQPMIVIGSDSLQDASWTQTTMVHEFFHATQAATGAYLAYVEGSPSAWYTEATAVWSEGEVYPNNPTYAVFLYAFAFQPHLPLGHFNYPDSGALDELHQYGAFIFPRYLSEVVGDWTIIVDSWLQGPSGGDPLDMLDEILRDDWDSDVYSAWTDFIGHNATWDYEDGSDYRYYLDWYRGWADYYGWDDDSWAREHQGTGPALWSWAASPLPQRYGSHTIPLHGPQADELHVAFDGAASGSEGSDAQWSVQLVMDGGGDPTYHEVPLTGGSGALQLDGMLAVDDIYLVVGAWSAESVDGETFDYRYQLYTADVEEDGVTETPGGCASAGAPDSRHLVWALPLLLLGLARRRR